MRLQATVSLALLLVVGPQLSAQAIRCAAGEQKSPTSECVITRLGLVVPITISVEGSDKKPLPGARLKLTVEGTGSIDTLAITDALGYAPATWRGPADIGDKEVRIKVEGRPGTEVTGFAPLNIVLRKMPPPLVFALDVAGGNGQTWYAGKQLPAPIEIRIAKATEENCEGLVVYLKGLGESAVAPDSARGRWRNGSCVAEARWKLAGTVGEQSARATLGNVNPVTLKAFARKEPWLAAGLAVTKTSAYDHIAVSSENIQVVSKSATAETTFTVPKRSGKLERLGGRIGFTPTLGINTPVRTSWRAIRASISADAQHLTTDWFGGLSLPQLRHSIWSEEMGVDVQLIGHVSRRDVVVNASDCSSDVSKCVTDKKTALVGGGLSVQLNASSALAAIVGLFPK